MSLEPEQTGGSDFGIALSIHSEHGLLHGKLLLVPAARGFVVLAHDTKRLDARDDRLANAFRQAGFSTLSVDLISSHEENFPDIHNNVPLLARRLIDFLGLIKLRMQMGELPTLPIGLFAANATTPVAVRVAALRDHDIAALVCRGGLIDLAGVLYLRTLASPLLVLAEESDIQHIVSSTRALQEVTCRHELQKIPEIGIDYAVSAGFASLAQAACGWFGEQFDQSPPESQRTRDELAGKIE